MHDKKSLRYEKADSIGSVFYVSIYFLLNFSDIFYIYYISLNKNTIFMKIFFIWLGVICCGIANGLLYSNLETPKNFIFMSLASTGCVVILLIHRRITKKWKSSSYVPITWRDFHLPVFRITMLLSFFFLVILIFRYQDYEEHIVACITILVASFIAYKKELSYTHGWL